MGILDNIDAADIKSAVVNRADSQASEISNPRPTDAETAPDGDKVWEQFKRDNPTADADAVDRVADAHPDLFPEAKTEAELHRQAATAHQLAEADKAIALRDHVFGLQAEDAVAEAGDRYDAGEDPYELLLELESKGLGDSEAFAVLLAEMRDDEREQFDLEDHERTSVDSYLLDRAAREHEQKQIAATQRRVQELDKIDEHIKAETGAREKVLDEELRRGRVDATDPETMFVLVNVLAEMGGLETAENSEQYRSAVRDGIAGMKGLAKASDDTSFRARFREVALKKGDHHFNHKTGQYEIEPATVAESLKHAPLRTTTKADQNASIKAGLAARIAGEQKQADYMAGEFKKAEKSAAHQEDVRRRAVREAPAKAAARVNRSHTSGSR
jgi:hypothetical protein